MEGSSSSINDLAKACAHSASAGEWEEFLRRASPLVQVTAMRAARMWMSSPSPATVDDIVQEVFVRLCEQERRILREFEPRGEDSFFGLLRTVSVSVANDYFRRLYSVKRGGKVVTMPLLDETSGSTSAGAQEPARMHQSALFAQLDRKLRSAPETIRDRDRALFWLYYRQGLTAGEIAALPSAGLTAKGVESALRRVTVWLRGEIEKRKPEG
jgi:RNA polymerase sigma-70 factor (ECF subfamily)